MLHGQRKYISHLGCFKCVPHVSVMTVILLELKTSLMILNFKLLSGYIEKYIFLSRYTFINIFL